MRNKLSFVALSVLAALAAQPALAGSETGSNTWYGFNSATSMTTGSQNVIIGNSAGSGITTGTQNVAVGYSAAATAGTAVTAIGYYAGYQNTGNYNVFLGNGAGFSATGSNKLYIDNCTYMVSVQCDLPLIYGEFDNRLLAFDGQVHISNKTTGLAKSQLHFSLAGTDVGGWLTSAGENNFFVSSGARYDGPAGGWIQRSSAGSAVVAGSGASGYRIYTSSSTAVGAVATLQSRFHIDYNGAIGLNAAAVGGIAIMTGTGAYLSAGGAWTNASSRDLKEDIRTLSADDASRTLEGLQPVSFRYKATGGESHVGFIAEDVPELVATRDRKGVSPMDVVAVLTKVVKEQDRMLADMKEQLAALNAEVRRMQAAR
jgi:hypothetical protein